MQAIIYESNSGFTKQYADILAEKLNKPCYSSKEAVRKVKKGAEIIFLGWVFANQICGFKKAARRWNVKAVGAVGLYPELEANIRTLEGKNKPSCPLFYLRGGLDYSRLKGIKKKLIQVVRDNVARENKPENAELLDVLTNGGDFVSEENLTELVAFGLML